MIGGLSGLAAVVAGITCIVLVPLPLLVIVGVLMQASMSTLLILALFYGWLARSFWRWLTTPYAGPNEDTIHLPRGVKPEVEASPKRKDEPVAVLAGSRTSLDDPEDDEGPWDIA